MHRRIAERLHAQGLSDDAAVAELARHAALAQDHALAAAACVQAGRRCLRVFANDQAAMLAQRGLRHARSLREPESVTRTIELLEVQLEARRPPDKGPVLEELEELGNRSLDLGCGEHARLAFHLLSYLTWETGAWSDARRHMLRAEMASRTADPRDQVSAMAEAARCLVLLERDMTHAHALLKEADARARPLRLEPAAIADGLGLLELHRGALDEAAAQFSRAEAIASVERNHPMAFYALEHLIAVELERGRHEAAQQILPRLAELAEKLRDGSEAPFAGAVAALVDHALDPDAGEALEAALEPLRAVDAKYRLAFVLTRAGLIDLSRGAFGSAFDRAEEALELAEILDRPSERALALGMLAEASRARGDTEAADGYRESLDPRTLEQVAEPVLARLRTWGCLPSETTPG
jgi:tetratricopeptide (TPR) repeat protein